MKRLLLAGAAFLGLAASGSAARATPFDFTYSGSLEYFTIPTTDTYQILAFGAQGGTQVGTTGIGGKGAEIAGNFNLTAGEVLQVVVGGAGLSNGGGGGGSFVVGPGNTPLVIAGGGGGGGSIFVGPVPGHLEGLPGEGGLTGLNGGDGGAGGTGGSGGSNGTGGGSGCPIGSGGGGGLFSGGFVTPQCGTDGAGGGAAFPGLAGGSGFNGGDGGFGGGGGGGFGSGGGGGGYSGGGGGGCFHEACGQGGGGGSFDAGADQILVADFQTGNGEVVITEVAAAIPEPASIALLGAGLAGLAVVWRRRRPET